VQAAILNQSKYSILNDMINFRFWS
jgi:hypothetical protein